MGQGGEILGSEAGIDSRTFHNPRSANGGNDRRWHVCDIARLRTDFRCRGKCG